MRILIAVLGNILLLAGTLGTLGAQEVTHSSSLWHCSDGVDSWTEEVCQKKPPFALESRIAKLESDIRVMMAVVLSLEARLLLARASGETWRDWVDRVHPEVDVQEPGCFGIPCSPLNENRPTEWRCQKDGKEVPCGSLK